MRRLCQTGWMDGMGGTGEREAGRGKEACGGNDWRVSWKGGGHSAAVQLSSCVLLRMVNAQRNAWCDCCPFTFLACLLQTPPRHTACKEKALAPVLSNNDQRIYSADDNKFILRQLVQPGTELALVSARLGLPAHERPSSEPLPAFQLGNPKPLAQLRMLPR
eukprot:363885-Chlamydomonas_euryale.AAC.31